MRPLQLTGWPPRFNVVLNWVNHFHCLRLSTKLGSLQRNVCQPGLANHVKSSRTRLYRDVTDDTFNSDVVLFKQDTTYEAGVCSYVDAGGRFPWCATEDDVTSFTDETGKKNWDFCTCGNYLKLKTLVKYD